MNKKNLSIYPILFVMMGIIVLMNLAILPFSVSLFFINIGIVAVLFALVFVVVKNYKKYVMSISQSVQSLIKGNASHILESIPLPVVITESTNKILFYNSIFKETLFSGKEFLDVSITEFLTGVTIESVLFSKKGTEITYNNCKYNVFAESIENFTIFYFVDITEYKNMRQEYVDSRPCVGFILFDNREELKQNATDEQSLQISIAVENLLGEWTRSVNGIIKKLRDGKFIVIFEGRYLKKFTQEKFKILDKIHSAKIDELRYATISMGISRGAKTLLESAQWAKNALDMSLGRGGDQVTIKNNNSYEFFGGTSQGLEKRSKVRTRVVAMALLEQIGKCDNVFIMGHRFSDFDSIGAAAGIWSICTKKKKKPAYIVVNKEQSLARPAIHHLEKAISSEIFIIPEKAKSLATESSLLIIVDTHSPSFLESEELYKRCKNIAVIDHHRMTVDKISNSVIFFHEPFASSACEMVTELLQYMGDKALKKPEAECLLAGIMLDTKNFFLKSGIRTFEAAAYLKKRGADSVEIKKMFANSMDAYKIKCRIIESAKIIENCAITKSEGVMSDLKIPCAQAADELLDIQGVKASFVIFQDKNEVNISARSAGQVNVQVIMEALGGGGHYTMAAVQMPDITMDDAEEMLIEILKDKLKEN